MSYSCPCCSQECYTSDYMTTCSSLLYCDGGQSFLLEYTDYEKDDCIQECPLVSNSGLWIWIVGVSILSLACCCVICNCWMESARRRRREYQEQLRDEVEEDERR